MAVRRRLFACLGLLVLLGCAACTPITWERVTLNRPLGGKDIGFIAPGRTSWTDVIARLGVPGYLSPLADGFLATYFYYDAADFSVDFGWPLGFIGPISRLPHQMQVGTTGIGTDMLQIGVDRNGLILFAAFVAAKHPGEFRALPVANQ